MADGGKVLIHIDGESKGFQSAMNKAGSIAKTAAKGIAVGAGAAATAIGAIGTQAVKAYADYEQLVGGVETLFKQSANVVQNYANQAYQTAGMSANQYMETVTSFSASLLQSLKGDTASAAEYANQAVVDMSDNANKMGTSIEMIQNAYQGFAKQNYTMLDNLKLGYGGTKEEMLRLVNDAAKLDSSIKANDLSFANIVKSIHAVQTEMGITGTTYKEAATTIQGSLSMVKASWENLMTGLADPSQNLDELIDNFFDSLTTFSNNILPVIENVLNGITQLITKISPKIIEAASQLISELLPTVIEGLQNLLNAISEELPNLAKVLSENTEPFINAVFSIINTLIANLPQFVTELVGFVTELFTTVSESLITELPTIFEGLGNAIVTYFETFDYSTLGITIIANISAAIVNALPALLEALLQINDAITNKSAPDADKVSAIFQKAFSKVDLSNVGQRLAIDILDAFLAVVQKMAPSPVQSLIQIMRNELGIQRQTLIAEAKMAGVDMVQVMEESASNMGNVGAEGGSLYAQSMAGAVAGGSGILSTAASQMLIGAKTAGEAEAANGGTAVGQSFDTNAGTAIASGSGEVSNEAKGVITEAKSSADSEASNFSSVGENIVLGIINGITGGKANVINTVIGLAKAAVKAAASALGIKSPSKVFRDKVGKWIPLGMAVGIEKYQDSVIDAIKNLITDTRTEVQKVLDDMNEEKLESEKAYQDELKRIEEEEYQEKLKAAKSQEEKQKLINERAQKEKLELLKDTAEKERKIYDANQKDIENSQKSIMNSIQNLAETAIDSLEKVEDKQKDFRGKLRDFGDLVGMATFTSGDKEIEFPIVGDYSQINTMLENYLDIMEKLKARGDLPQEFFDQFLDMDVGEATTKAQAFVNMSDEAFNTYMDNYKKSLSLTDKISKVLYADQVEEAKQEVIDAFGQFNEDMEEQGGENAKAWIDGFIEKVREIMPDVISSIGLQFANLLPQGAYAYEAATGEMGTYINQFYLQAPKDASVQEQIWEANNAAWLEKQRGN